jgi:hypothetical protein
MATPDGISTNDWEGVHRLAVDIANACLDEDDEQVEECRDRLLGWLDRLEEKYGELPSVLATRADYIDDARAQERLLTRAYELAEARGDELNGREIAHPLAALYVEDLGDPVEGRLWLKRFRQRLLRSDDAWHAEEHERLRAALQAP